MSLIPEFEIGLWNVWVLAVPPISIGWIFMVVNKKAGKRAVDTSKEKTLMGLCAFYYVAILYSIFVPLKLGTIWFYTGLAVYILGFIPLTISYFNFTTTPPTEPVVKGVYRISRNPLYFFTIIALLGASIAGASWLMILIVITYSIPRYLMILAEERFCLKKYGDAYREYMKKTPRYMGVPRNEP